jgi:hypothetical protein
VESGVSISCMILVVLCCVVVLCYLRENFANTQEGRKWQSHFLRAWCCKIVCFDVNHGEGFRGFAHESN